MCKKSLKVLLIIILYVLWQNKVVAKDDKISELHISLVINKTDMQMIPPDVIEVVGGNTLQSTRNNIAGRLVSFIGYRDREKEGKVYIDEMNNYDYSHQNHVCGQKMRKTKEYCHAAILVRPDDAIHNAQIYLVTRENKNPLPVANIRYEKFKTTNYNGNFLKFLISYY